MERTRVFRRFQRSRTIRRKKSVSRQIYGMDWFQGVDGKYNKGHIGCGCRLCKPDRRFRKASPADARKSAIYAKYIADYKNGRLTE